MLDKSDESLTRVYNALANPTRRQIVQILKERGKAGFKELHDTLRISVGALYHHLHSLEGFVAQGTAETRFLLLVPLGWFITFAVADVMCNLFYHRSGAELSLTTGTAFAMLPLLLVPGLILLVQPFSAVIQSATAFTILLQVGVQVWVVCLLSSAISISKGLKMERTALISLAV